MAVFFRLACFVSNIVHWALESVDLAQISTSKVVGFSAKAQRHILCLSPSSVYPLLPPKRAFQHWVGSVAWTSSWHVFETANILRDGVLGSWSKDDYGPFSRNGDNYTMTL